MSVTTRVVRDTKHVRKNMSELAVRTSFEHLEFLMKAHHRGPRDTWGAARDRAAKAAGIEPTYAKRLWNRWQTMKDVSGGVFMALQAAYEAECEKHEKAADYYRSLERKPDGETSREKPDPTTVGMVALSGPKKPTRTRRIPRD